MECISNDRIFSRLTKFKRKIQWKRGISLGIESRKKKENIVYKVLNQSERKLLA